MALPSRVCGTARRCLPSLTDQRQADRPGKALLLAHCDSAAARLHPSRSDSASADDGLNRHRVVERTSIAIRQLASDASPLAVAVTLAEVIALQQTEV